MAIGSDRDTFTAEELAVVLSQYDLGAVEAVREFPRGSRRSPKLILRSEKGDFMLKRRARGKDDAFRVAFAHSLQLYLARKKFPLPHLIGTRRDNNSMFQWRGSIYELFEFIKGSGYDNSPGEALEAGRVLGAFHLLVKEHQPEFEPPSGSYHASRAVGASFDQLPSMLMRVDPDNARRDSDRIDEAGAFLKSAYNEAAIRTNECGLPDWPLQITHCDWHPGNALFSRGKVVAVIDYDSARLLQRVTDVANGALQFSILAGGDDPAQWPDSLHQDRFQAFLNGYDTVNVLSKSEIRALPWLMIEAIIAESVIPIAATGSFARMEGIGFLLMIERKVHWLQQNAEKLAAIIESG
jgi:Ser/Thr protein kinase RdoA (MazF antagonist)